MDSGGKSHCQYSSIIIVLGDMEAYISLCYNVTARDIIATALNISVTDIDNQLCERFVPYDSSLYESVDALAYSVIAAGILVLLLLLLILVLVIALCCVAKKLKR